MQTEYTRKQDRLLYSDLERSIQMWGMGHTRACFWLIYTDSIEHSYRSTIIIYGASAVYQRHTIRPDRPLPECFTKQKSITHYTLSLLMMAVLVEIGWVSNKKNCCIRNDDYSLIGAFTEVDDYNNGMGCEVKLIPLFDRKQTVRRARCPVPMPSASVSTGSDRLVKSNSRQPCCQLRSQLKL